MRKLLSSKIAFFCLLVILVFFANLKYKQWQSQKIIDKEKAALIKQAQDLDQKNADLKNSLSYLGSADFNEKVAKSQLNLKKPGEQVFGFTQGENLNTTSQLEAKQKPNWEKWIEFFSQN